MKKIINIAITAVAAIAAVSCSSLMEKDVEFASSREVVFKTNLSDFQTKAAPGDSGFTNGDEIGVIAMEPINVMNVKYTVNGQNLVSDTPVHWLEGQQQETDFAAYFPYDPEFNMFNEYGYNITVSRDQSTYESYHKSDFLVANGEGDPGETVVLEFYHYNARVDISVPEDIAARVKTLAFGGVYEAVNVGNARPVGDPVTIKAGRITNEDGTAVWSLILPRQSVTPTLIIETTDGETLSYTLGKEISFDSGKRYNADLKIKEDGSLDMEFVFRIFDWLGNEWIWFEPYVEKWYMTGSEWNWSSWYQLDYLQSGIYMLEQSFGESALFKFGLDALWTTNLGGAESNAEFDGESVTEIQLGKLIPLRYDGFNLYAPQSDSYKFTLDTKNKTLYVEPNRDWNIVSYNDSFGEFKHLEYAGEGHMFKLDRVYLPSGEPFFFEEWRFGRCMYAAMPESGAESLPVETGKPMAITEGGGCEFVSPDGGYYSVVIDPDAMTVTFVYLEDQSTHIADVLSGSADGTAVTISETAVVASYNAGFVISDDGTKGLLVYLGIGSELPAVGDKVTVSGAVATYNNVKEIVNAQFSVEGQAVMPEVVYEDISNRYLENLYCSYAAPVTVSGTLSVTAGYSDHLYVRSDEWGTVFMINDTGGDYLKYSGSKVTVTGWYNGLYNGPHFIVMDSIKGLEESYHGAGTLNDPYDAVGACLYGRTLAEGAESADPVYVRGRVRTVDTPFSIASNGTATFSVSANADQYECYFVANSSNFLENKPWQFGNTQIQQWMDVIICCKVTQSRNVASSVSGTCYIYSLYGKTSETPEEVVLEGDGTKDNPFNVTAAVAYAQGIQRNTASPDIYVKGIVLDVWQRFSYGYNIAGFSICDDIENSRYVLSVGDAQYLGKEQWQDGDPDIENGSEVIVCCSIYGSSENWVNAESAWLYSLDGTVKDYVPYLRLSESDIHLSYTGGESSVRVYSNTSWSVSAGADWFEVYSDGDVVYIYVYENSNEESRQGNIYFYYGEAEATTGASNSVVFTVYQTGFEKQQSYEGEVIWEGQFGVGDWDNGLQDLAWGGYDWTSVAAGTTLRFYLSPRVNDSDYWQFVLRHGMDWADLPEPVSINLTSNAKYVEVELSETNLADIIENGGLVVAGCYYDLYAITIMSDTNVNSAIIWEGPADMGTGWENGFVLSPDYFGKFEAGYKLKVNYTTNSDADYYQVKITYSDWTTVLECLADMVSEWGTVSLTAGSKSLTITPTESDVAEMWENGLVLSGYGITINSLEMIIPE